MDLTPLTLAEKLRMIEALGRVNVHAALEEILADVPEREYEMIRLSEATIGVWCIELDDRSNWLAHLARKEAGKFVLEYGFGYRRDDNDEQAADERSLYRGELKSPLDDEEAVVRMRKVYEVVLETTRYRRGWELVRNGMTLDEFERLLVGMPTLKLEGQALTT